MNEGSADESSVSLTNERMKEEMGTSNENFGNC